MKPLQPRGAGAEEGQLRALGQCQVPAGPPCPGRSDRLHRLRSPIRANVTASSWKLPLQLGEGRAVLAWRMGASLRLEGPLGLWSPPTC